MLLSSVNPLLPSFVTKITTAVFFIVLLQVILSSSSSKFLLLAQRTPPVHVPSFTQANSLTFPGTRGVLFETVVAAEPGNQLRYPSGSKLLLVAASNTDNIYPYVWDATTRVIEEKSDLVVSIKNLTQRSSSATVREGNCSGVHAAAVNVQGDVAYFICSGTASDFIILGVDTEALQYHEDFVWTQPNPQITLTPAEFDPKVAIADDVSLIVASSYGGRGLIARYFFVDVDGRAVRDGEILETSLIRSELRSFGAGAIEPINRRTAFFCTKSNPSLVMKLCDLSSLTSPMRECGSMSLTFYGIDCRGIAVNDDPESPHVYVGGDNFQGVNPRGAIIRLAQSDLSILDNLNLRENDFTLVGFLISRGYLMVRSFNADSISRVILSGLREVDRSTSRSIVGIGFGAVKIAPNDFFWVSQTIQTQTLLHYQFDPDPSATTTTTSTTTTTVTSSSLPPPTTSTTTADMMIPSGNFSLPPSIPLVVEPGTQGVASTATTLTSVISASTATQTLRSYSILSTINTGQRCRLYFSPDSRTKDTFEDGVDYTEQDTFASDDRGFPESLFPWMKIYFADDNYKNSSDDSAAVSAYKEGRNNDELYYERRFGLPSRRGAIVFGTFCFPPLVVIGGSIFGYVKQRHYQNKATATVEQRTLGILAHGRVFGLLVTAMGALAMDGIIASSFVLLNVPRKIRMRSDEPISSNQAVAGGQQALSDDLDGSITSGMDTAIALWGIMLSALIVIVPGVMLNRRMKELEDEDDIIARNEQDNEVGLLGGGNNSSNSNKFIECVPNAYRSPSHPQGSEIRASCSGSHVSTFLFFVLGSEVWTGDQATIEKYRQLFSKNRGLSQKSVSEYHHQIYLLTSKVSSSKTKMAALMIKYFLKIVSTWSVYIDIVLVGICAGARGYSTTTPCSAQDFVPGIMMACAIIALIIAIVVQPPLSPIKRMTDIFVCLMLVLASAFLSSDILTQAFGESENTPEKKQERTSVTDTIRDLSLVATFSATSVTICIFLIRRIILPWKKVRIVAKRSINWYAQQEYEDAVNNDRKNNNNTHNDDDDNEMVGMGTRSKGQPLENKNNNNVNLAAVGGTFDAGDGDDILL